jgi:hypothetical protein
VIKKIISVSKIIARNGGRDAKNHQNADDEQNANNKN